LGESLQRLQLNLDQTRTTEVVAEERFHEWRSRWSARRDQISQRLELLDQQLEMLARGQTSRPQLSLVAAQPHEMPQTSLAE
jgi:hypothetical protein